MAALRDISLEVERGEFVAVMGPSGCGKSTLLHIMGAMDRPTSGEAWIEDAPIHALDEDDLTRIRRTRVGFVFQFFHLLPAMTVAENVALPLLLANGGRVDPERVSALLDTVNLAHRRHAFPNRLSGGEMQRAAVARALAHDPPLIVADEPTGNLDTENGAVVLDLLTQVCRAGTTVIVATHSDTAAAYAHRTIRMRDGRMTPEPPSSPSVA